MSSLYRVSVEYQDVPRAIEIAAALPSYRGFASVPELRHATFFFADENDARRLDEALHKP